LKKKFLNVHLPFSEKNDLHFPTIQFKGKQAKPNSGSSTVEDHSTFLDEKVVLTIKKCEHCYETSSIPASPFRFQPGKSKKFLTYESALEFIALHCFRIHDKFTRELARLYIPWCFVFQIKKNKYVPMSSLSNELFSSPFRRIENNFSKLSSLK
jgi:hypothetical protein